MSTKISEARAASFESIAHEAKTAGHTAGLKCKPTPMHVGDEKIEGGVCGFAWIMFKRSHSFGNWAENTGLASESGTGNLQIWVTDFGQSMERKRAYAEAYVRVLMSKGIIAHSGWRLD